MLCAKATQWLHLVFEITLNCKVTVVGNKHEVRDRSDDKITDTMLDELSGRGKSRKPWTARNHRIVGPPVDTVVHRIGRIISPLLLSIEIVMHLKYNENSFIASGRSTSLPGLAAQ